MKELSQELSNFITQNSSEKSKADRNIDLFLEYFGFYNYEWTTYRELQEKPIVGTHSRAEQIIKESSRKIINAKKQELPTLYKISEILNSVQCIDSVDFKRILAEKGLIKPDYYNPMGIIRLLKSVELDANYSLYDYNLDGAKRNNYSRETPYLIINDDNDVIKQLKKGKEKAKDLSGDYQVVSISFLLSSLEDDFQYSEILTKIITENPKNIVFKTSSGNFYFHIYRSANNDALINTFGKVFNVATKVHIKELIEAIRRPVRRRVGKLDDIPLQQSSVIRGLINAYHPLLQVKDDFVTYSGDLRNLNKTEQSAVEYLKDKDSVAYFDFL